VPFPVQFDRVAANLDYSVAGNGIPFMGEGEWSAVDLNESKAPVRFG